MKKEARPGLWRKQSLRIFQTAYMRKVKPRARPGPSCWPSRQPGGQEKLTGQKS